jgi:hypothetical protein
MHRSAALPCSLLIVIVCSPSYGYQVAPPSTPPKTLTGPETADAREREIELKAWQNLRDLSELSQIPLAPEIEKKTKPGIELCQKSTIGVATVDFDERMRDEELTGPHSTGAWLRVAFYNSQTQNEIYAFLATDPEGKGQPVSIAGHSEFTMYKIEHSVHARLIAFYRIVKIYKNKKLIQLKVVIENFYKPSH